MKNLGLLLILAALGWYGYGKYKATQLSGARVPASVASSQLHSAADTPAATPFSCDGRTKCSQMSSCAEAMYFLQHCPNTEMDGNKDGEPCEQQWCN